MPRIFSAAAVLLSVVLVATCLTSPSTAAAAEKAPNLKPCFFYPTDNATSPDACGTNDAYTVALKRNQIKSTYGKLLFDDILTNHECEKTLTDEAGCLAPTNPAKCVWVAGYCQSNGYVTSYKMACDGSKAKMYYECLARFTSEGFCNGSKNCAWAPALAEYNQDSKQTACYLKEVANLTGEQFDDWLLTKGPNNVNKAFYEGFWGKCAAAKSYYNARSYVASCTSAKDQGTCNDRACDWSPPYNKDKCFPDPSRNYALRLAGGGLIREQFMQCFSPALALKGEKACNDYTLA